MMSRTTKQIPARAAIGNLKKHQKIQTACEIELEVGERS